MAVYYKFLSGRNYNSIPIDGSFISVHALKEKLFKKLFKSKYLKRRIDSNFVVTNAQTNEEYLDEAMLIPKNTSLLIRHVPQWLYVTMLIEQKQKVENKVVETEPPMKSAQDSEWDDFGDDVYVIPDPLPVQSSNFVPEVEVPLTINRTDKDCKIKALNETTALDSGIPALGTSAMKYADEDSVWDEFANELYERPDVLPVPTSNLMPEFPSTISKADPEFPPPMSKAEEDRRIKILVNTPALDWQQQGPHGFCVSRGFGRGMGGQGLHQKIPPPGYVCHRCKVQGHFIQHCPTNGDPTYDIKKVKQPTGIPRSMLIAAAHGSCVSSTGDLVVVQPDEATFEKEMEGIPSSHSVSDPHTEIPSTLSAV